MSARFDQQFDRKLFAGDLIRLIVEATPDAVFVKDTEGRYLYMNPAGASVIGKSVEEVIGRDDTVLFSAVSAAEVMGNDRRIMTAGAIEHAEDVILVGNERRVFKVVKGPLYDSQGTLAGLFGVASEVTSYKRLEHDLRASRDLLHHIAEATDKVFWMWEPDGKLEYVSPSAEKVWGISFARILENPWIVLDAVAEEDLPALQAALAGQRISTRPRIVSSGSATPTAPFAGWGCAPTASSTVKAFPCGWPA